VTAVLVTGADGFIGRNLCVRLAERGDCEIVRFVRGDDAAVLAGAARRAEFVFHLAGVNRPPDPAEFAAGNAGLTEQLVAALKQAGSLAPVAYTSSIQAERDNPYGRSKLASEQALLGYARDTGAAVHLFRLPNVFGKWSRPDYNSAVATFCHRIARGEAIDIHAPDAPLQLVYVDDVVDRFLALLDEAPGTSGLREIAPVYDSTVGEVAEIIGGFPATRESLVMPGVGAGLVRALYSTFLSFLPAQDFAYRVPIHADPRGEFVEMLKTRDTGQFSYFTANPGVTRGDHYHHSKAEKFLVIAGTAHFGFRHIVTGETHELVVTGGEGRIVESIPGWTHNVTNVGDEPLLVMLWANEIFDRDRPDTVAMKV